MNKTSAMTKVAYAPWQEEALREVREETMEKISATLAQLRAGARRVSRKVPEDQIVKSFGALTLPTKRMGKSPIASKFQAMQQSLLGKDLSDQIGRQLAPVVAKHKPGTIFMSPRVGKMLDPTAGRKRVRGLRDVTALHESAERSAPLALGSLHGNPAVLAKDFNLLSRLSGPGSRGVRRSFGSIRKPEFDYLQEQLKTRFGARAAEFMQPGRKIPKAMRRRIEREGLEFTPERLQKAMQQQAGIIMGKQISRAS